MRMKKSDRLLANLTVGVMVFLDHMNKGDSDHSKEAKENNEHFRKSLSDAFVYLNTKFPSCLVNNPEVRDERD